MSRIVMVVVCVLALSATAFAAPVQPWIQYGVGSIQGGSLDEVAMKTSTTQFVLGVDAHAGGNLSLFGSYATGNGGDLTDKDGNPADKPTTNKVSSFNVGANYALYDAGNLTIGATADYLSTSWKYEGIMNWDWTLSGLGVGVRAQAEFDQVSVSGGYIYRPQVTESENNLKGTGSTFALTAAIPVYRSFSLYAGYRLDTYQFKEEDSKVSGSLFSVGASLSF